MSITPIPFPVMQNFKHQPMYYHAAQSQHRIVPPAGERKFCSSDVTSATIEQVMRKIRPFTP